MNASAQDMKEILDRCRQPEIVEIKHRPHAILPDGVKLVDLEALLPTPTRFRGTVALEDTESFIAYTFRHALEGATVYCSANYTSGKVSFVAVLNEHAESPDWRDFRATFEPQLSEEWKRWTGHDRKEFGQAEFAAWLEENLPNIATIEGLPTGSQMLQMALNLEASRDMRFKSALRLQSGGVQLQWVDDENAETVSRMQMFERFALGVAPFWNGPAYRLDARLRYRINSGAVRFWFELVRPDKVLEDAAKAIVATIREKADLPVLMGRP